MNCLEFRRLVGADPSRESERLSAHGASCPACAEYARQLRALDARLRLALRVPVPDSVTARSVVPPAARSTGGSSRRWFALAASMLLAAGLGSGLWLSLPRESLATAIVDHVQHEPDALVRTGDRVAPFDLESVMRRSGVRMSHGVPTVSYARSCQFRGDLVPHLVVQSEVGPVTVFLLRNERVDAPVDFAEQGYVGTLLPSGKGTIAVLGEPGAAIEEIAHQVESVIEWLD